MSAFLNYTEKVSFPKKHLPVDQIAGLDYNDIESSRIPYYTHRWSPPDVPEWSVLDANQLFINWPEWTGDIDSVVLVHFVDGAAYTLYGRGDWDASVQ